MKTIPLYEAPQSVLDNIKGFCFDIDDTFSTEGKITDSAFNSLWDLKRAGFTLIPITGRPAGWCDHIARFWPVDAVVGENGAFTLFMKDGKLQKFITPGASPDPKPALKILGEKILARFPDAKWASDQAYREYDLAIDFCEDVKPWQPKDVDALVELCKKAGAHAKVSSIHVNAWFGDYDKKTGFEAFRKFSGIDLSDAEWIFAGDSPNDEPMFGHFENSVGVANIATFLDRLKTPPSFITQRKSGEGFTELANKLLGLT